MYADRESGDTKMSIRDRLNIADSGTRRGQITGKRLWQDDGKWEHDLYDHDDPQVSNRRVGTRDLRLKLQKRPIQKASQSGRGSLSGVRDLREMLSGTMNSQPLDTAPPKKRVVTEGSKPARKIIAEALAPETKKVTSTVSKKKAVQKAESVDSFLQSLELEKYTITFHKEEVDMAALIHMNDDDLKALGIPMGPRKKIRLALDSKA